MHIKYYGELIAVCTALSWSIGIFPFTEAARRLGPNPLNHFRIALAVVIIAICAFAFFHTSPIQLFTTPRSYHWIWFGASGVVGLALGDYYGFTAFAILGPRIGSLFSTLAPTAALFLGYFVLDERINFIGILGILVTIAGVAWLTLSRKDDNTNMQVHFGNKKKGIIFGVLSALCQGAGLVMAKKGLQHTIDGTEISVIQATFIRMTIATSVMYSITIVRGKLKEMTKPILENQNNGLPHLVAGTFFGPVLGVGLSMYAVSLTAASVAQTIFSLVPVMVLPLAFFIKKEKITTKAVLGSLLAIVGVIVLVWRDKISLFLG